MRSALPAAGGAAVAPNGSRPRAAPSPVRPFVVQPPLEAARRTRREVAAQLLVGCGCAAAACGEAARVRDRPGVSAPLAAPPRVWSDARFAADMHTGMADYERQLAPLKAALFGGSDGGAASLIRGARVLELGIGTGVNLKYFGSAASVVGLEPNLAMHDIATAAARSARLASRFSLVAGTAEEARPFAPSSFDAVVATNVLCSVADVRATLAFAHSALRPGGTMVLIEHVLSPRVGLLQAAQRACDPLQAMTCCGCHLARDHTRALAASPFSGVETARFSLGDADAMEHAATAGRSGGAVGVVRALRGAVRDGGAGWGGAAPPKPHFLLSPHIVVVATA